MGIVGASTPISLINYQLGVKNLSLASKAIYKNKGGNRCEKEDWYIDVSIVSNLDYCGLLDRERLANRRGK
ncbi:hypothetical protein J14TS2_03640 [Bacillus sp. J14TS2]|nr:hypothetical protein J14TS2_03640 [Bacillus sp. J14TS2]